MIVYAINLVLHLTIHTLPMKKIKNLIITLAMFAVVPLQAQLYQRQYILNFATADFQGVKDIIVEPGGANIMALADLSAGPTPSFGISLNRYNSGNGNMVAMSIYYAPGAQLSSHAIRKIGTDYFVLGTYTDAAFVSKLLLLKINAGGTVVWAKVFDPAATGGVPIEVVDMDFDGTGFLYATGNVYASPDGSSSVFVAKFDLAGALQWFNYYDDLPTEEFASNIDYYDNGAVYVGAVTAPLVATLNRTGFVLQVNDLGNIAGMKHLAHYTPAASPRMTNFFVTRANANDVFIAGSTLVGADGSGPMLFAKLNAAGLGVVNYTIYSAPEFFLAQAPVILPGKVLLSGTISPSGGSNGYVNAFFDYSTAFLNASRYNLSSGLLSPIRSDVGPTGIVYSIADNQFNSKRIYRIKGSAANASTPCSENFVFTPQPGPFNNYSFTLGVFDIPGFMTSKTINLPVSLPTSNSSACPPPAQHAPVQEETTGLSVYPNPATDYVVINLPDGGTENIQVIDGSGKVVRVFSKLTETRLEVTLEGLAEGIYAVRIEAADGAVNTLRFAKK